MSVAICTPARLTKNNHHFEVFISLGTVIAQLRTEIAVNSLKKGYEWLLWIDSDMHFPDSIAERLLAHNERIVAATYSTRYKPQRSVAFLDPLNYDVRLNKATGLHKVWAVGMGCMLVHRSVFETIEKPWFGHDWDPRTESFIGEDLFFCQQANNHGFDVYVDANLSQEIGHYGTKIFLLQETKDQQV